MAGVWCLAVVVGLVVVAGPAHVTARTTKHHAQHAPRTLVGAPGSLGLVPDLQTPYGSESLDVYLPEQHELQRDLETLETGNGAKKEVAGAVLSPTQLDNMISDASETEPRTKLPLKSQHNGDNDNNNNNHHHTHTNAPPKPPHTSVNLRRVVATVLHAHSPNTNQGKFGKITTESLSQEEVNSFKHKLQNRFVVSHYGVLIAVDTARPTWAGAVQITGVVQQETSTLLLHAAPNLHISSVVVMVQQPTSTKPNKGESSDSDNDSDDNTKTENSNKNERSTTTVEVGASMRRSSEHEIVAIDLKHPLAANTHVVVILAYQSDLSVDGEVEGLYGSSFKDQDGETHIIISTQFEPESARRMVPCVDEPAMKAVFEVVVCVPRSHQPPHPAPLRVLSNMPEAHGERKSTLSSEFNVIGSAVATSFFTNNKNYNDHHNHNDNNNNNNNNNNNEHGHATQYRIVHFEPTPRMSSYLLAVVVGRLGVVQKLAKMPDGREVEVNGYCEPGFEKYVEFAVTACVASLEQFSAFFQQPYILPKMDMVAIPNYAMGAMENWGLVTYHRESYYLDPESDSLTHRLRVASVVWHENAHQWFGNLVTMRDWDELYLNEGFASFMETYAANWVFSSEYPTWTEFLGQTVLHALDSDALANTHALALAREADGSVSESAFDAISYDKGASLLYMLRSYITALSPNSFEQGVARYIANNKFSNADSVQLWKAIAQAAKRPEVEELMKQWCKLSGFPLVSVSLDSKRCSLSLSQKRFVRALGDDQSDANDAQSVWTVPLYINFQRSSAAPSPHLIVLESSHGEVTCDMLAATNSTAPANECCFLQSNSFVKVNHHHSGFVRVHYDNDLIKRLTTNIDQLPAEDVLGLLSDMFAINELGPSEMRIHHVLGGVWALAKSKSQRAFTVWAHVFSKLIWIDGVLAEHPSFAKWRSFLWKLVDILAGELGTTAVPNEPINTHFLRQHLIGFAVHVNHADTVATLSHRFKTAMSSGHLLNSYLKSSVYSAGVIGACSAAHSEEGHGACREVVDWMIAQTNKNIPREAVICWSAVTRVKSSKQVDMLIQHALKLPSAMAPTIFNGLMTNTNTRLHMWSFYQSNFERIKEELGERISSLFRPLGNFASTEKREEVEKFFAEHGKQVSQRSQQQVLETIQFRENWVQENSQDIDNFLAKVDAL